MQEQPFDASRKRMTTFHRQAAAEQGVVACTKGAPELVLPCCSAQGAVPLDSDGLLQAAQTLAAQGLRVLALARRDHSQVLDANTAGAAESSLQYLGLIAVIDPPRAEARDAVRDCMAAGITPVMITGDHPAAARAIALRPGIVASADAPVLTGADLTALDEAQLRARVGHTHAYAWVDPVQKIRSVEALQADGQFVAMAGDGDNGAPALKRADIAIAMARGGTDVAREAPSLVLLGDNSPPSWPPPKKTGVFTTTCANSSAARWWAIRARSGPSCSHRCCACHPAAAYSPPLDQPGYPWAPRAGAGGRARRAGG